LLLVDVDASGGSTLSRPGGGARWIGVARIDVLGGVGDDG
jgi:hypothetical protein